MKSSLGFRQLRLGSDTLLHDHLRNLSERASATTYHHPFIYAIDSIDLLNQGSHVVHIISQIPLSIICTSMPL